MLNFLKVDMEISRTIGNSMNAPTFPNDWQGVRDPVVEASLIAEYMFSNPNLSITDRHNAVHSLSKSELNADQLAVIRGEAERKYMRQVIAEEMSKMLKHVDTLLIYEEYSQ